MRRRPRSLAETPPGYTISIKAQTARQSFVLLKTVGTPMQGYPLVCLTHQREASRVGRSFPLQEIRELVSKSGPNRPRRLPGLAPQPL